MAHVECGENQRSCSEENDSTKECSLLKRRSQFRRSSTPLILHCEHSEDACSAYVNLLTTSCPDPDSQKHLRDFLPNAESLCSCTDRLHVPRLRCHGSLIEVEAA